jgi:hypothetical protein
MYSLRRRLCPVYNSCYIKKESSDDIDHHLDGREYTTPLEDITSDHYQL